MLLVAFFCRSFFVQKSKRQSEQNEKRANKKRPESATFYPALGKKGEQKRPKVRLLTFLVALCFACAFLAALFLGFFLAFLVALCLAGAFLVCLLIFCFFIVCFFKLVDF